MAKRKKEAPRSVDPGFFERGEIVRLRSGGPAMTVENHNETSDVVSVVWFSGSDKKSSKFSGPELFSLEAQ
ncbi:DUF2158 domain-containing protein [Agrobacterium radiobacter]|jgi:uncharacterized protein YodC (DUF2158 family)|uniref:DUF2158 domain-containing protein n=1 Tax=Agrobacterium tumefaciens complex TaxID=1183400 RepID=UPI0009BAEE73|nr:DUF2158 domain-containing protein [Agrobacterium tumefaciens]NTA04676.1 DUF2158 domain-containing protein [Agrobacterium tumefaciens]NTA91268.1 DUF2158 domain-containing protein [Agrobacterium tumefaciens]NTB12417.1 DUF2158 domain-containing protein [Agrobacterium tumefaciens]